MLTIAPRPWASMRAAAARAATNVPIALTANTRSQSSGSWLLNGRPSRRDWMPALLTRISTAPRSRSTASIARSTLAASVRSASTAIPVAAVAPSRCASRSSRATAAPASPSRRPISSPIPPAPPGRRPIPPPTPPPPPVTTATRSPKSISTATLNPLPPVHRPEYLNSDRLSPRGPGRLARTARSHEDHPPDHAPRALPDPRAPPCPLRRRAEARAAGRVRGDRDRRGDLGDRPVLLRVGVGGPVHRALGRRPGDRADARRPRPCRDRGDLERDLLWGRHARPRAPRHGRRRAVRDRHRVVGHQGQVHRPSGVRAARRADDGSRALLRQLHLLVLAGAGRRQRP